MEYALLLSAIILAVLGQLALKSGVTKSQLELKLKPLLSVLLSPMVLVGFLTYGVSAVIWLFVLKAFPLSVAYPSLSLTYVLIVIFSKILFEEPVTKTKTSGVVLIISGVVLLFS